MFAKRMAKLQAAFLPKTSFNTSFTTVFWMLFVTCVFFCFLHSISIMTEGWHKQMGTVFCIELNHLLYLCEGNHRITDLFLSMFRAFLFLPILYKF